MIKFRLCDLESLTFEIAATAVASLHQIIGGSLFLQQ